MPKKKYNAAQLAPGDLVYLRSVHLGARGLFIVEGVDAEGIHLSNANGNGETVRTQEESDVWALWKSVKTLP